MKKPVIIFCLSILLNIDSFAQLSGFGVRAGANLTMLSNSAPIDQIKAGFHVGAYFKWGISSFFMIQPEAMYSLKGTKSKKYDTPSLTYVDPGGFTTLYPQERIVLNYIDVPIFARFNFTRGFHALIGPQASFLVHGLYKFPKYTYGGTTYNKRYDNIQNLNYFDFGAAAGLGYEFNFGLSLGVRASYGFIPLIKNTKIYNSNVQLTAGFTLGGRKRRTPAL